MGDSLLLFILQSSVVAIFTCDKLVILKQISPDAVVNYGLTGRLFLVAYGIFMVVLSPDGPRMARRCAGATWRGSARDFASALLLGLC